MRKITVLFLMILTASICFGEHIIFLKNGDKLRGKLRGGKRDSVAFSFMGNRLMLSHNDIMAIYFDENTAPKSIIDPNGEKDARLKVVSTQTLTIVNQIEPDEGASVYIIPIEDAPDFNVSLIDTFKIVRDFREIYDQYTKANSGIPEDVMLALALYNAETDVKFENYCRRTYKAIYQFKNNKKAIKATCDAKGEVLMPIKSGQYYVLIVSKKVKGKTVVEQEGKIDCQKIEIQPEEEYTLKMNFEVF